MIRLIISDIDGTLVPEGGSVVNPEYMVVIRKLLDLGVQFAAASGRQTSSIDAIFHELRDRIYYLGDNGEMATGWKEVDGQMYYFYPDGHKAVNEYISGFYVDLNGVWKKP